MSGRQTIYAVVSISDVWVDAFLELQIHRGKAAGRVPFGHSNLIPVRLYRIDRNTFYLFKRRYDHSLGRNRWLRDCAYGQADPRNERSYGEEAEAYVFLSSVIIRKKSAGG